MHAVCNTSQRVQVLEYCMHLNYMCTQTASTTGWNNSEHDRLEVSTQGWLAQFQGATGARTGHDELCAIIAVCQLTMIRKLLLRLLLL